VNDAAGARWTTHIEEFDIRRQQYSLVGFESDL
jgi:hypothetical protein